VSNMVGSQLGDYVLKQRLATGGMAEIYLGEDTQLRRRAAVKVLSPDTSRSDKSLSERFEREARAIASLEHDNIVPIYQFGKQDGLYFLAMRYVEGSDLADEIHRYHMQGYFMPIERALYILGQVASALDYAHEYGIIHRDVKPSNVLLGPNDKAILTDFGLVLWQSVEMTYGTAFGTPRYISPEQATDSMSVVPQSDVYSLAVIAYEIVTRAHLFEGQTPMEVALAHVSEDPIPPSHINPAVPPQAEEEILRALSKSPERRHQTAIEFINALRNAYDLGRQPERPSTRSMPQESDENVLNSWDDSPTLMEIGAAASLNAGNAGNAGNSEPHDNRQQRREKTRTLFDRTILEMSSAPTGIAVGAVAVVVALLLALGVIGGGTVFAPVGDDETAAPTTTVMLQAQSERTQTATATTNAASATPTSTATLTNTATPARPTAASATPQPLVAIAASDVTVRLQYNERSLIIVNESDEATIDISGLAFSGDLSGSNNAFGLGQTLAPQACVAIVAEGGEIPNSWNCEPTRRITLSSADYFWRASATEDTTFTLLLSGTPLQSCDTVGRAVQRVETLTCSVQWP
jgi:serine/threonine protein kinase